MRTILFLMFLPSILAANIIDLGTIESHNTQESLPIFVSSSNPQVSAWAEKALDLHGGITIANKNSSLFFIQLEPISDKTLQLTISSGSPEKIHLQQIVEGGTLSRATTQALDLCTKKLLGLPGFFSGKIAFVSKQNGFAELFVSDLLFSNIRQLTHDHCDALFPHWFPDTNKLIYTTYKNGVPDLYTIQLQSKKRIPFASYQGNNTGGSPSPNGQNIAMILSATGNTELFVRNIHSPKLRRLTKDKSVKASPSWSPDANSIVFVSDITGRPQLFLTDALKGPPTRLPTNISRHCTEPQWNPLDPNRMLFTAAVNKSFQIAEYNMQTQKSQFLTQGPKDAIEGCWLNDGRHIIFTQRLGKQRQLCILDSKTKKVRILSPAFLKDAAQASFVY